MTMRVAKPSALSRWRFVFNKNCASLRHRGKIYHPRRFFIYEPLRVVYLSIPKAACTSIKAALAKACGIAVARELEVHQIHSRPEMRLQEGRLDKAAEGYYKFSFVRNPFERVVSCYRDKVVASAHPQNPKANYFSSYAIPMPSHLSFAEFVKRISAIPDRLADTHFQSQYALLYDAGELQVDYLGRVENLQQDWRPVAEKFQLSLSLNHSNVSKHNAGSHSDYRCYYTEALAQLVYERYRRDVEEFGYEEEYHMLLEFIRRREA